MNDALEVEAAGSAYGTFRRRQLAVLVGITLVAAVLRLFRLGEWAFWVDEAHTFRDVAMADEVFWRSNVSNYPLSYGLLRWLLDLGMMKATGEGWLRLPFAFFGILTVPALAVFGRSVVGRRAALLAAAFLALSPWHLYWSQNARGYSMTAFFGLLAAFAVHRAVRHRSVALAGVAVVCASLAALAHPSGALMLLVLVAFWAAEVVRDPSLRRSTTRLPVILGAGVVLAVVAVWIGPTVWYAIQKKPEFSIQHLAQTFAWFLGPPFVVAAVGGACVMALRSGPRETAFLVAWVLAPLVALVVIGATMLKVTAQYGLVLLPAVLLLASRLIVELADAVGERARLARLLRWSLPFVLLASLGSETFLYFFKRNGDRPLWRDAASFVSAEGLGAKVVVSSNEPSMRYYLDRGSFWGEAHPDLRVEGIPDWRFQEPGGGLAWFEETLASAADQGRDLYFVITEPELGEWDRDGAVNQALRRIAFQLRRYPCWTGPKDMTVLVYKIPAPPD